MDDTQLLDCTQAMPCDLDDDEEEEEAHCLVAWLEVSGNRHEIFSGRNVIGRDADECKIVIPSKVLSKKHAVVEVRAGTHTLADLGSRNKTRLGKMVLRPHVQYALQGGEKIRFGNVAATYSIRPEVCDDTGSETGSESMLPMMAEEEERSSSPLLPLSLDHRDPQDDQGSAVENGIEVPSVPDENSHTPQAKETPFSASQCASLPQASDSILQPSDAESSVISATQSPAVRPFTLLSPKGTCKSPQEDYNSDASTDVEDNAAEELCPTAPQCETPTNPVSCTVIPETPAQSSPNTIMAETLRHSSSPSTSIQETPTGPSPLTPKRENTPAHPCKKTYISETPSYSSPSATVVKTPARTREDDLPRKSHDSEDLLFKKPLAASTVKIYKTPTDPSSPKSSVVSKAKEAVPVHLFSTKNSHPADPDATTQVFTSDVPGDGDLDAPTQVFTNDIDLDAPTQVFTHDTSVDLDAPTQVFASDVDLDAPTQVFTSEVPGDTNLDAPTQVFTSEVPCDVDLDAPTQVFTGEVPSDVDLDAPTQVFTSDVPCGVDLDAPTQVFTSDVPSDVDLDAPTQVFTTDPQSDIDLDAPTQLFTNDLPSGEDPVAPTQVFNNDAASDIVLDPPTQVFNTDAASDADPDAPTQVFNNGAVSDVDPDALTQVFNNDAASDVDPDAPTQVFNNDAASDVDPGAPTQVFNNDAASDVDPDAPTQVFNNDAASDVDPDAPTQVFNNDAASDVDPDAPTQVFNTDAASDVDPDAPTQVFNNDAASDVDPDAPKQMFNNDAASDVGPDAPTQVLNSDAASDVDPDAPTQVFNNDAASGVNPDAPTQVFNDDAPSDVDPDAPTQVLNNDAASDVDPDPPTQTFDNDASSGVDPDAPTQVFVIDAPGDIDLDAPAQVFSNKAPDHVEDKLESATRPLPFISVSKVGDPPSDDLPSSPKILSDTDDTDIPTQPYSDLCADTPRPSSSIIEAWGRLESTASQSTNTASLPDLREGNGHENDAASDTSKSLFDEEDEAHSPRGGENETGMFEDIGNDHKLKGENYHSDESTDLEEDTPTKAVVMSSHKTGGKASPSQSLESKDTVKDGHVDTHLKTSCKQKGRKPAWLSESDSEENTCNQSLRLFDLPSDIEVREQMTSAQHSSSQGSKESSEDMLAVTPHKERAEGGETQVTEQTTFARPSSQGNKESSGDILAATPHKEGAEGGKTQVTEQTTFARLSSQGSKESSEGILAVTPHRERAGGGETQVMEQRTSTRLSSQGSKESSEDILAVTPHSERAKHHERMSEDESEENINNSSHTLLAEGVEAHGKDQRAMVYPTRRTSSRLCPPRGSTSQNKRGRAVSRLTAAVSVSIPAASLSTPITTHISTQACTPSSLSSALNSTPTTLSMTTTPNTSTLASTPTSTHTQASLQSIAPAPNTRRQGRKGKTVRETISAPTSVTDSSVVSIPTRRYGKRSISEDKVHPATTTANNNKYCKTEVITTVSITTATSTTTVIPATSVVTATATTPSITAAAISSPPQNRKTRQRTEPQRVTSQLKLNVKDPEAVSISTDSALSQPSTSAATDTSSIPATTRRRRGRPSAKPPVIKIKVEVPDDEPAQMTTLTTIKQEKEEIETLTCDQIPVKVEPEDSFSGEGSKHSRRTRRKPERFSPETDNSLSGKSLRSKKSLPSAEPTDRVLRENTGGAGKSTAWRGRKAPGDAPGRQRRSQRVQATKQPRRQEEGGVPVVNSKELTLNVRVKEEPEVSEEEPSESLASHCSADPETDPPPKKNSRSRASTSGSARQAPSRATKKIKMEVIPREENDDGIPGISESSKIQSRTKEAGASYRKKKSNQNTSCGQRAKRSNSDASDAGSLASNNSFSSRATRSNKDAELWSPSKRQRQASSKPRVLFTGYHDPADHKIVADLGGRVVETPLDCTVLVTTKLKRTCKLLSAIGRGHLIVSPNWLTMSKAAGNFVDPWQFLLKDHDAEEKFGFCLEATIKSASNFLLFEGLSLHATPSVQPPPCQMRDIIECAGGDYLHAAPKKYEPQIRIISCPEDRRLWPVFTSLGIPILGVEFILTGLLRHELLLDEFVLG